MLYEVLHFMAEREKYGSLNLGLDNSSQIKKDTNNAVGITSSALGMSISLKGESPEYG